MDFLPWVLWVSRVVFTGARATQNPYHFIGEFAWLSLIAD